MISYSNRTGVPLTPYGNGSAIMTGTVGVAGSEIINFSPLMKVKVEIVSHEGRMACLKMELFGCHKSSCIGEHSLAKVVIIAVWIKT